MDQCKFNTLRFIQDVLKPDEDIQLKVAKDGSLFEIGETYINVIKTVEGSSSKYIEHLTNEIQYKD